MLKINKMKLVIPALMMIVAMAWLSLRPPPQIVSEVSIEHPKATQINQFLQAQMREGNIPGMSVVVIENGLTSHKVGLGMADIASQTKVNANTQFELASNTKAFTGLALHTLEQQGLLSLSDKVRDHLPAFNMQYEGEDSPVTLQQVLHHTSGIPFDSITLFSEATDSLALSRDVAKLNDVALVHPPGSVFLYATINYDVLGAIIAKVSGLSYEDYVTQAVLQPLGLNQTSFVKAENHATGYKHHFGGLEAYDAPIYRGNAPAAYLSSNINDVERWLKIQLGLIDSGSLDKSLFEKALRPDRSIKPWFNGGSYASGWWSIQQGSGEISHSGNNPNFSTFMMFFPQEQKAVAVLANINSDRIEQLARGINNILLDQPIPYIEGDMYASVDKVALGLIAFMLPFTLVNLGFLVYSIVETRQGSRKFEGTVVSVVIKILVAALFLVGLAVCVNSLPKVFFGGVNWNVVNTWAPNTLILGIAAVFIGVSSFSAYTIYTMVYQKPNDKQIFVISALGALSGLGNTFCIFTINMALQSPDPLGNGLYIIFLFGMVLYVLGQKVVRTKVLSLTNQTIFNMRMGLVRRILSSPYHQIEKVERENIQTVLNNDAELISQFPHYLIMMITSATTLLFCFIYLGSVSIWGLLLALLVVTFATMLFFTAGARANAHLEKARTVQEYFFAYINDLTAGLKELNLNNKKKAHFHEDMKDSCQEYCDSNVNAGVKYINVLVMGELLFTIVIGFVAFIYPAIFKNLSTADLTTFVLVFLYMTGPVNGVLNNIPHLMKIKVAWKRVCNLTDRLDEMALESITSSNNSVVKVNKDVTIELKDVTYEYYRQNESQGKSEEGGPATPSFIVGPVSCYFNSGEITFITGGNGSGKSTLAKLITGLYVPSNGQINVNDCVINSDELNQLYTAIFWDYHLFNKLYGVNAEDKQSQIDEHLDTLRLSKIVNIEQGKIASTDLSTGQRKRLALLVSHLDERPIYLFDEWAADQDPEYRKVFYQVILPELKRQNKCVIVISHDDHYFNVADKIIKMEMGKPTISKGESAHSISKEPISLSSEPVGV
ncbi:hypothetical protein N474_01090 [Pseudoalteromonas luteoviolacea CPMOR-2]|uniref:cyclic peptide export ABC transporter n=1 Tax=Pseudoalteromonas luteoviolacea TaxID=43657 RepID=UPI0007B16D80|nr:cyclic peptide export ABC transporter [Pseudoalteromonas luteoviolacea]KZN55559.1 hypothetical protein N474_01090 [Pseudoalteromonas luteoviolacea CPMOR-2]